MAKAGRKNKPTALKLIDGNPGKRPISPDEPMPPKVYDPDPPRYLTRKEKAKWRKVARRLAESRILTELDLDALEIYCREWCNMQDAIAEIAESGKLLTTEKGGKMYNPAWPQLKHSQSVCRSLMAEFGMTPSSRTGVAATADDSGKDRWQDF